MDPLTAVLMSIGTGTAAGLRPYLTVFVLSLAGIAVPDGSSGFLGQVDAAVPASIANPWVLGVCAVLALGDGGLDKVLGLNLPLEAVNQVLRPVFGALVGAGIGSQVDPGTALVGALLGGGAALPVSLGKGGATMGLTAAFPEPASQVVRSVVEDVSALVLVVVAMVAPFLGAVLGLFAIVSGVLLFLAFRSARRAMRTRFADYRQRRAELDVARAGGAGRASGTTAFAALRREAGRR